MGGFSTDLPHEGPLYTYPRPREVERVEMQSRSNLHGIASLRGGEDLKIHLIWLGADPNHRTFKCIESVLRAHAGHEVHLWSDGLDAKPSLEGLQGGYSNLVIRDVADVDAEARRVFNFVYERLDAGHQPPYSLFTLRSDMYRLLILKGEGGLYLDTDIYCLKDVSTALTTDDLYIGEEVHEGSAMGTNGVLGARNPGNSSLGEMIELGRGRRNIDDWGFIGPKLVTEFFNARCNAGGVSLIKSDLLFPVCRYNIHRKLERHPAKTVLDYEVSNEVLGVHIYDQIYGWTNHRESDFKVTVFPPSSRASRRPALRPRLHLLSVPTTTSNARFEYDEAAAKSQRFARMMTEVGYEVFHYGVQGVDSGASKNIDLGSQGEFDTLADAAGREALFNQQLADALPKNLACHRDIVCLPRGRIYEGALRGLGLSNPLVEFGVCYPAAETFAPFKIFHSYATYHHAIATGRGADHFWVIPEFFDLREWEIVAEMGRYLLFVGDFTEANGGEVIDFISKARPDLRVKVCSLVGDGMPGSRPPNIEFVDPRSEVSRSALFGGALATLVPTRTLDPFANAAVQSMLTGTPVLGSDFGSLPEIVVPGVTGFLCHNLAQYLDGISLIERGHVTRAEVARYARAKYDMKVLARAYDVALRAIHDAADYNWDGTWRP